MREISHRICLAGFILWAATLPMAGQDAKALRAQANAESNQERVVQLLCKAADLEPKNKDYRKDCDVGRTALINSDKTMLKTAQEASDAGKIATAKRYAKYVSALDPELHRQAEQLLAKLNGTEVPPPGASTTSTQPNTPNQGVVLAQALAAYDSGNLQAAKAAAQNITDVSLKPAANRLLSEIERYAGMVSAGQRHEQAKEYSEAERSYQSALELNSHVGQDDLAGRAQRMHQLAAAAQGASQSTVASNHPLKPDTPQVKPGKPGVDVSPDDKKRRLLEESAVLMSKNDFDGAGRRYKQVLEIDPANAMAKLGLKQISDSLNRDPVRLEKTLREAIVAFYSSHFEDAESRFNRYLGADVAKKKGAAYFYLGATEATLALLEDSSRRQLRSREANEDFRQARQAGYKPIDRYVSARVLAMWNSSGT